MTISDANPVQFWDPDQETFNEREVDGIFQRCFCAPWNCDNEIFSQFQDNTGLSLSLVVIDQDESIAYQQLIQEIQTGIYQVSFTPSDQDLCDSLYKLKIINNAMSGSILAPSAWDDDPLSTPFSSRTTNKLIYIDNAAPYLPQAAQLDIIVPIGDTISFDITIVVSGTFSGGDGAHVGFYLLKNNTNTATDSITFDGLANGTYLRTVELTANELGTQIYCDVFIGATSGTSQVEITVPTGQVLVINESAVEKKSDCLEISESHDETVLIEYSSNRNFAGLIYSNVTPDPSFFLRVPAIFFRQRFPQEKETIELSNSRSIQLSAQVKAQKHLQVKNMPDYMHRKLLLALSHQFVTIDGQDWVLSEEYELIPPSNPRWPMQKAQCWLTEKDYIMRSVL